MKPALKEFVALLETELAAAGFVRRGPVYRYFAPNGNGIIVEIQQTGALSGGVDFYVNVGLMLAPHLRWYLGDADPWLEARPMHGIWDYRVVCAGLGSDMHRFSLTTEADAERAFQVVRAWLATGLPKLMAWTDVDAMVAGSLADQAQSEFATAEQLRTGRWVPGRHPDGTWRRGVLQAYVRAERGDLDGVLETTADWKGAGGAGSMLEDLVALATRNAHT